MNILNKLFEKVFKEAFDKDDEYDYSYNSMDDYEECLGSYEMQKFLETSGCKIISSPQQEKNGTIVFLTDGKKEIQITKAGYIRVPNESGDGTHILNPNPGKSGTQKVSYMEGLKKLQSMVYKNPMWFTKPFDRKAVFGWQEKTVNKYRQKHGLDDVKSIIPNNSWGY